MLAFLACLIPLLAAPDLPELSLRAGREIVLDGKLGEAEWADAFTVRRDHPLGGRFRFSMKRTGPWLALAISGDRPYRGEVVRLYVADAAGGWIANLVLGVGQPHMPPALWRRGPPASLGDAGLGPGEPPRACRVRLDVGDPERWAAEYLIRLSALGIGRGDRREFRALVRVTVHRPKRSDVLVLPGGATDALDPSNYARLVSPDGWGAAERWEPVPPEVSLEFDDHELLYRLFLEYEQVSTRDQPRQLVIASAVTPRSMTRIDSLRGELAEGRRRNPTLPAWTYFLGRLLNEGNLYDEARAVIESVPKPLASFEAFARLEAEYYLDTEQFQKALDVTGEPRDWRGRDEVVKMALKGRKVLAAEKEAVKKDAAKTDRNPRVRFVTDKGAFVVELFEDDAPHAVRNFMDLVMKRQYYDGMRFHEVSGGHHAIVGDPRTRPGSTETKDGPPWRLRPDSSTRGLLTGYLTAIPVPGEVYHGSQIIFALAPIMEAREELVFGRVVEGLDVLMSIEQEDRLQRVEVLSRRNHAYDPLASRFIQ